MTDTRVLLDGLRFPEGPRWHAGRFWFSDMHSGVVIASTLDGDTETITQIEAEPSGLGWLPDGICLDSEGAIWVASPLPGRGVFRVREGGEVTERIAVEHEAFACMLGGPDRRTLFICTAPDSRPDKTVVRRGRIEIAKVQVPGSGLP